MAGRRNRRRGAARAVESAVQSLTAKLANATLQPSRPGRRRRARQRVVAVNVPAAEGSFANVVAGRGRRRGRRNRGGGGPGPSIGNGGQITITRCELLRTVSTTANKTESLFAIPLYPSTDQMSFLFRLASCYCRLQWASMRIDWRPSVGTTTNGIITYGVRFAEADLTTAPTSRLDVASLFPVNDHPVWQTGNPLVLSKELLMSRKWYSLLTKDGVDLAPGGLQVGLSHDSTAAAQSRGEFWVTYTCILDGTRSG